MPTIGEQCRSYWCTYKERYGRVNETGKFWRKIGTSGRPPAGNGLPPGRVSKRRRFHLCSDCVGRFFPEKQRCATEGCKSFVLGTNPNMLPSQQELCKFFCKACIKQGKAGNPEETEDDKRYRDWRSHARESMNENTDRVLRSMGDRALCPDCGPNDPECTHGYLGNWKSIGGKPWKVTKLLIKKRTPWHEYRRLGQRIRRARKRCDEAEIQKLRPLYDEAKAWVRGPVEEEAESGSGSLCAFREATREAAREVSVKAEAVREASVKAEAARAAFKAASVKAEAARAAFKANFGEATKASL